MSKAKQTSSQEAKPKVDVKAQPEKPKVRKNSELFVEYFQLGVKDTKEVADKVWAYRQSVDKKGPDGEVLNSKGKPTTRDRVVSQIGAFLGDIKKARVLGKQWMLDENYKEGIKIIPRV